MGKKNKQQNNKFSKKNKDQQDQKGPALFNKAFASPAQKKPFIAAAPQKKSPFPVAAQKKPNAAPAAAHHKNMEIPKKTTLKFESDSDEDSDETLEGEELSEMSDEEMSDEAGEEASDEEEDEEEEEKGPALVNKALAAAAAQKKSIVAATETPQKKSTVAATETPKKKSTVAATETPLALVNKASPSQKKPFVAAAPQKKSPFPVAAQKESNAAPAAAHHKNMEIPKKTTLKSDSDEDSDETLEGEELSEMSDEAGEEASDEEEDEEEEEKGPALVNKTLAAGAAQKKLTVAATETPQKKSKKRKAEENSSTEKLVAPGKKLRLEGSAKNLQGDDAIRQEEERRREERNKKSLFVKAVNKEFHSVSNLKSVHPDILSVRTVGSHAWLIFPSESICEKAYKVLSQKKVDGKSLLVDFCGAKSKKSNEERNKKGERRKDRPINPLEIVVAGLPKSVNIEHLKVVFPSAKKISIPTLSKGPKVNTVGFVRFENEAEAKKAFIKGESLKINGEPVDVWYSRVPSTRQQKRDQSRRDSVDSAESS